MEYNVPYERSLEELMETVRAHIKDGWRPLGAPFPFVEHGIRYFAQAMTRGH